MRRAGLVAVLAAVATAISSGAAQAATAPGAPGAPSTWTTGAKQGFGTSANTRSHVWHTLAEGVMTEAYFPQVDVANVRDLRLLVTDGRTFVDDERTATTHAIELLDDRALVYRQVNTAKSKRYRIEKTYVTDPSRHTILMRVRLRSLDGRRYRVFARFDPSLANTGTNDTGASAGGGFTVREGEIAAALRASEGFARRSTGYAGSASDGLEDLRDDFDLDGAWTDAPDGNVVQTGELELGRDGTTTLALGFGETTAAADRTARDSLRLPFAARAVLYAAGWHGYLRTLDRSRHLRGQLATQWNVALMTLRAHEDKIARGANVASLTVPWGEAQNADNPGVGGYHLVWSRDLYQVATALIAAGDEAGAERALDYLFDVQQRPDGSFPQNSYLDGRPYWPSLQLDEVAFPIVLAWQLGRDDAETWRDHVKKAADFLVARGPSTPQERWEEEGGFSPSTIAAEIAGLVTAADIARANGDTASAVLYEGVADDWQRRVESWTFTTTGPLGDGRYFERIDGSGNPDDDARLDINNGGGNWAEREIVDAGFLELVRLGVKRFDDPEVLASLPEIDSTIAVDTPNGRMFYRYNHDGYGEKADGAPYDGTGVGRLWPLLTGERGEYELAAGRAADEHLRTMARSANAGYLIPEQVWDRADTLGGRFAFGEGTGSATPLAWSMAQYARLAAGIQARRVVEQPAVVAQRYAAGDLPAAPSLTVTGPADGSTTDAGTVDVTGTTDGTRVVVNAGGRSVEATPGPGGAFSVPVELTLGPNQITVVAVGADGGTAAEQLTVTSTDFGTPVGAIDDPAGDDHGPGSYVYPASDAFNPGAFDLTRFAVYEDGDRLNLVTTIAGEVRNPWGGNQIAVQRLNVYVTPGGASGPPRAALPGVNAQLEAPWSHVVVGDGFEGSGVFTEAGGASTGSVSLLALPVTRQIAMSIPRSALGSTDPATARYAVTMLSHAAGDEGVGLVRPVYSRAYWDSTAGTGMSWIHDFRFGGGAGEYDGALASRDTDTRDPNAIDVTLPPGASQAAVLDWTAGAPVTIPFALLQH